MIEEYSYVTLKEKAKSYRFNAGPVKKNDCYQGNRDLNKIQERQEKAEKGNNIIKQSIQMQ